MDKYRLVAPPAYLVASVLIVFPLFETALMLWPFRIGQVAWRFGAAGMLSRAFMTPLLGLLIAYFTALALDHRWVQRTIAVLAGASTVLLIGAVVLLLLDSLQLRSTVAPEGRRAFDVAAVVALAKCILAGVVSLSFAIASWKTSARAGEVRQRRSRRPEQSTLIVRS